MTNDKTTAGHPEQRMAVPTGEDGAATAGARKPLRILGLEIDENDDLGGDPYNRTGSFCVPEFHEE